MYINNLMATNVDTLTFIDMINTTSESLNVQGFFSGVSGAVIRPLSQWQMPTFFPNLNKKKNPNQKVIFM